MRRAHGIVAIVVVVALAVIAGAVLSDSPWLDERTLRAIAVERRVVELHLEIEQLKKDEDDAGVEDRILQMAALDPDHPKPYLETVQRYNARRRLEEAPGAMDALGTVDGPGRLYGQGLIHAFTKQYKEGLPVLERALEAYRARGHLAGQAATLTAIGNVLTARSEPEQAFARYAAVPALLRKLRNRLDLSDAYANLAKHEAHLGRHESAVALLRKAVALRQELGDKGAEARGWHEIGMTRYASGDAGGAIAPLERALELRREIHDQPAEVATLLTLAAVRQDNGDTPGAISDLDRAREVAHSIGHTGQEIVALERRAHLELAAGRPRDALESFGALATLHDQAGKRGSLAGATSWIGTVLNRLGEYERARQTLEEVLSTARELEDRKLEAAALTQLGVSLFYTGDIPGAFLTQQQALVLHRELDHKEGMLANHGNLAAIHYSIGDPRARDAAGRALELAEAIDVPEALARAHNNLGVLLLEPPSEHAEPDPEAARGEFEAAARIWRRLGDAAASAETEGNLAEAEARLGDVDGAARRVAGALAMLEREGSVRGRTQLHIVLGGIRLAQGRTPDATEAYRQALSIARDHGLYDKEWRALDGLSEALESDGRRGEAIECALLALDAVERSRARLESDTFKVRYLARRIELYERAIGLVLTSPDGTLEERVALSFQVAERARARGLLDLLAEGRSALRERMPSELRRREEAALDGLNAAAVRLASALDGSAAANGHVLAGARTALAEAEDAFEQLQVEIRRTIPEYGDLAYPVPATLARVQGMLRPGEILLEYFVGRRTGWVWIVGHDRVTLAALSGAGAGGLEREVSNVVAGFAFPGGGLSMGPSALATAERLATVLLPTPSALTGATRLIVVPDGALTAFPFELLPIGDDLLIDRHEIAVIPSASTLAALREHAGPDAGSGFLGVGDPLVAGGDLPRLPFARQELDRVGRLFQASDRDLLLGDRATKAALRQRTLTSYRFVHFATHGWEYDDRWISGLRLSGEESDPDTLLTLREIPGLELRADVVVLSACRSGAGRHYGGEGRISLARAFLHAGARSVVASLWDVSDDSTADFMESFYRGMLEGRSAAAALRRAKIDFLHSDRPGRRRPYRWAPFILFGEPDTRLAVNRSALASTVPREGE